MERQGARAARPPRPARRRAPPHPAFASAGQLAHATDHHARCPDAAAAARQQNGAVYRGYVGSDGRRYASPAAFPAGVTAAVLPAATAYKADALPPGVAANAGAAGNVCLVECANRGVCNAATGACACLAGYYGSDCATASAVML